MVVSQSLFTERLFDPSAPWPEGLSDGVGHVAGRRFNVYRNNVMVSLIDALAAAFPVIQKLLGEQNFSVLAQTFARAHPPSSPLMMYYGAEMPEFLAGFEPTRAIGYLPDIARLEIALRESYHAADAAPVTPEKIAALPAEALTQARVTLVPSARLIRSSWPIHAIWTYNTQTGAPKPVMQAEDVLILRPDFDPAPHLLPPGGGAFVQALLDGASLGDATGETDPTQTLALLISGGALLTIGD